MNETSPTPADRPAGPAGAEVEHHHLLVQAPVPALDVDGLNVVTVGTLLFAVASVLVALRYPELAAAGRGWWLGVCVSGFVLGLVGLLYCWNRRRRRQSGRLAD